ncbi:T9SS type A sorting domain-containing protein [Nonlabens dokdonensis]|nr:T9SS type A sorting domain-containing protein [Nonlabens dokdonensis]
MLYVLMLFTAISNAQFYGPDDFRISDAGGFGNNLIAVDFPDMAYNPVTQNYLVVWESDDTDQIGVVDNNTQIVGRFVDLNGVILGNDFLISSLNLGDNMLTNTRPRVAYNSVDNNFMVVYEAEFMIDRREIFGVIVDANGVITTPDFRITSTSNAINPTIKSRTPAISYNPVLNEYFMVYVYVIESTPTMPGTVEIEGQRISSNGALLGSTIFITDSSTGAQTNSSIPDVIFNSQTNEYVVTYSASPLPLEEEAYVTIVSQNGTVGIATQISNRGSISNVAFGAIMVRAAWDQINNQYLFVYESPNNSANEFDVFGVIYDNTMNVVVPEFEISMVAGSSTTNDAVTPDVEWLPGDNNYYVVFRANPFFTNRNEVEIFMRSVSNTGTVGTNLLRVSSAPVDEAGSARFPRILSNGNSALLTVYAAEDTSPASMMVDREYEIYGQFYGSPTLSVASNNDQVLSVFPNPVANTLAIDSNSETLLSYSICNVMGKEVIAAETDVSGIQIIDLSKLSAGLYFLNVTTDSRTEVHKILKK